MFLIWGLFRFFLWMGVILAAHKLYGGMANIFFQPIFFLMVIGIYIISYFNIAGWIFWGREITPNQHQAIANSGLIVSMCSIGIVGGLHAIIQDGEGFIFSAFETSIGFFYAIAIYYSFFVPNFVPNNKLSDTSNEKNMKSTEKIKLYLSRSLMAIGAVAVAFFGVAGAVVLFDTKSSNPEVQAMYEDVDRRIASEVSDYVSKNCKEMDWEIERERRKEIEKEERARRGWNK